MDILLFTFFDYFNLYFFLTNVLLAIKNNIRKSPGHSQYRAQCRHLLWRIGCLLIWLTESRYLIESETGGLLWTYRFCFPSLQPAKKSEKYYVPYLIPHSWFQ